MPVCSTCGEENPERAKFCLNCGSVLDAAPPHGRERKLVSILFADVTGSTSLGERLDPERLKDVMSAYFNAMRSEIEAEGGTVEKFIGDAVMAAFGVPQAHEDDPARALRAALRMRDRLGELNADLQQRYGVTLQARMGVNTGDVLASTAPRRDEGMVTGDAVNVAARLEQGAEPGQILVSERTARATRGFRFGEPQELQLKGKEARVPALALLDQEESPGRGVPGIGAPMVGRDRELDLLLTLFERVAAEKRPHLVTIYGDAGVGKSRLTAEFLSALDGRPEPPRQLRGRCLPYGDGVTYWPLAEILKSFSGALDSDPPERARERIREAAGSILSTEVAPDPARTIAALAYTVGLEDPEFGFADLPPRQVRSETHAAWRSFFSALATQRPTVVVIEDIHWADGALLDMLEELADRAQGAVLFICPSRPELTGRRSSWGGGRRDVSSIFLDPLSREEADRLVGFLLSVEDLPAATHEAILARAEGNPFFLEEILRHLIDEGRIIRSEGRWRAAAEIGQVVIPDTVQGVLAARIDLLGPDEKRALQAAAVVGRVFWTGPVARLLNGQSERLEDLLSTLENRELVLSRLGSTMAGDREYTFKHILTRDVAYESLPRRDRTTAHTEVARWIEEAAAERTREFAELLAYHYGEAYRGAKDDPAVAPEVREDVRVRAFAYLLDAARDARTKLAGGAARRMGDRALGLARVPIERARALGSLGRTALAEYRGDDAWNLFRAAVDERVAHVPDDRTAIARLCARVVEIPTRWPGSMTGVPPESEVRRYLELGFAHLDDGDSEERARLLLARGAWPWAFADVVSGDAAYQEAIDAGEQAAEMATRLDRLDLVSAALDGLGGVYGMQGWHQKMLETSDRRLELADRLNDPFELGDIFAVSAWGRVLVGRYREAAELAAEGERRSAESPGTTLHCVVWLGLARFRLGEWARVMRDVDRARHMLGDRANDPPGFAVRLFGVAALIQDVQGVVPAANTYLPLVRRILEMRGVVPQTDFAPWIALLMARRGEGQQAEELIQDVLSGPFRVNWSLALESGCDVIAERGEWGGALDFVERARAHAERGGYEALPFFADRLKGRAALATGDALTAVQVLTRARNGFGALAARWEAAVTRLSLGEALLAAGRSDQAKGELDQAVAVFDELRSAREQRRALELLAQLG